MDRFVQAWWLRVPVRLRRANRLLSEVWIDGAYLTAWPRAALIAPLAVFLLGLLEGATHWSYVAFANGRVSNHIHAIDFAQMLPLLFVAVICGTLSSQLGLLLVTGFALGDLLIAGPAFGRGHSLDWQLAYVYAPQLISYLAFFLLAVTPTLTAKAMAGSLPRWLQRPKALYLVLGGLIACAVQGVSVYAWTLAAPMIVRVHWKWAGETPPIAVIDYIAALNPWLPATAAVAMASRLGLTLFARGKLDQESASRARREMTAMDKQQASGLVSAVPKALAGALLTTVLISGLIDTLTRATWVFAIVAALFITRNVLLPSMQPWLWWSGLMNRVPVMVRWAGTPVVSFGLTRSILTIPTLSAGANGVPGAFGAEIFSFLLSLIIAIVLLPPPLTKEPASLASSKAVQRSGKMAVLALIVVFAARPVYAQICLDPVCCFGGNSLLAALAVAALIALLLCSPVILPVLLAAVDLGLAELGAADAEFIAAEFEAEALNAEAEGISVAERMELATQFYEDAGFTPQQIEDHFAGIDFSKPVEVQEYSEGRIFSRWEDVDNPQSGRYYTDPEADPNTLGINPANKGEQPYIADGPVRVLRSTANDIPDWTGSGNTFKGGGRQFFSPNPTGMRPL